MSFKSKIYKLFRIKKSKKVNDIKIVEAHMNCIIHTCNETKTINRKKLIETDYISMGHIVYNKTEPKHWLDNHDDYVLPPSPPQD